MGKRVNRRAPHWLAGAIILLAVGFAGFGWRNAVSREEILRTHNVRSPANGRTPPHIAVHRHEPPATAVADAVSAPQPEIEEPATAAGDNPGRHRKAPPPAKESWLDWVHSTDPWSGQTRLRCRGRLVEGDSTDWELEWSGKFSGNEPLPVSGIRPPETAARMDQLVFTRRERDRALLRAGRLRPRAFQSVGKLDGLEGELSLARAFRTGVTAGFRPEKDVTGEVSSDETVILPYVAGEVGNRENVRYSSKLGLMSSFYRGNPDRLAVLFNQNASISDRVRIRSRTTFDLATESGAAKRPTLTDLDLAGEVSLLSSLVLRAGLMHERTLDAGHDSRTDGAKVDADDDVRWRRWLAATHELPWHLRLSGEIAMVDEPRRKPDQVWAVSVARDGLPVLPQGTIVTRLQRSPSDEDAYDARLSVRLPFAGGRLTVAPGFWLRVNKDAPRQSLRWRAREASISLQWISELPFRLTATGNYKFHEDNRDSRLAEVGAEWRW